MSEPVKPNLEQLVEENLLLTREVLLQTQKIRRRFRGGHHTAMIMLDFAAL